MEENFIEKKANTFSIAALVTGIISLICCCTGFSFLIGIVGIVLASIGIKKSPEGKKAMGIVALVISILGTLLGVGMLISTFVFLADFDFNYYLELSEEARTQYLENYIDQLFQ